MVGVMRLKIFRCKLKNTKNFMNIMEFWTGEDVKESHTVFTRHIWDKKLISAALE